MSEEQKTPMAPNEKPAGPVEIHHEHESSYVIKFWQDGKEIGVAAQLIFTAGFDWPEVRFYHPGAIQYSSVPGVAPQVLVALGELCRFRLESPEVSAAMECPGCGGRVIEYEPERVICVGCGEKTDTYEAMKAAEKMADPEEIERALRPEQEPPKEREGA